MCQIRSYTDVRSTNLADCCSSLVAPSSSHEIITVAYYQIIVINHQPNYEKETQDAQLAGVSAKHTYPSIRDHTVRIKMVLVVSEKN